MLQLGDAASFICVANSSIWMVCSGTVSFPLEDHCLYSPPIIVFDLYLSNASKQTDGNVFDMRSFLKLKSTPQLSLVRTMMLRRFQLNSAKKFKILIYKMLLLLVLSCVAVILMLFLLKRIKTETYDLSSKFLADIIEEITTATTKNETGLGT